VQRRGMGREGPGVMGTVARTAVMASTASAVANAQATAGAEALRREQAAERAAIGGGPHHERAAQVIDLLRELAGLRDQGVLTDREFDEQKERLLAGERRRPSGWDR
jgi:hypothetical protein